MSTNDSMEPLRRSQREHKKRCFSICAHPPLHCQTKQSEPNGAAMRKKNRSKIIPKVEVVSDAVSSTETTSTPKPIKKASVDKKKSRNRPMKKPKIEQVNMMLHVPKSENNNLINFHPIDNNVSLFDFQPNGVKTEPLNGITVGRGLVNVPDQDADIQVIEAPARQPPVPVEVIQIEEEEEMLIPKVELIQAQVKQEDQLMDVQVGVKMEPMEHDNMSSYTSQRRFLKAIQSLVISLNSPSLSGFETKLQMKIDRIGGVGKEIPTKELIAGLEFCALKMIKYSIIAVPTDPSISLEELLYALKSTVIWSKFQERENLVKTLEKRAEELKSINKRVKVEKIERVFQATIDMVDF